MKPTVYHDCDSVVLTVPHKIHHEKGVHDATVLIYCQLFCVLVFFFWGSMLTVKFMSYLKQETDCSF